MKLRRYLIAMTAVASLSRHGGFRLDGAYLRHQMDTFQPHTGRRVVYHRRRPRCSRQCTAVSENSGGWPKNIPMHMAMSDADRERVAGEKDSKEASKKGCMDNDATTSEIRFLARMWRANGDSIYLDGARRGVRFILDSQYPNAEAPGLPDAGGWPQYYPLRGGYSDYFTFNDNLHINNMVLLRDLLDLYTEVGAILPSSGTPMLSRPTGPDCSVYSAVR